MVKGLMVVRVLPLHWQTLLKSGIKRPANDKSAHFTGARPYLIELGITQETPHGIVIDVTVPTCNQKEVKSNFFSLISGAEGGMGETTAPALRLALSSNSSKKRTLPATYPDTESHPEPPG